GRAPAGRDDREAPAAVAPIVAGPTVGRNEVVTVQNGTTGERRQVKYKVAQTLLQQGWAIVE
ncbi:MAG TPA: hypothetical protein VF576_02555, partial [Rubricoccaceae bacterium]